MLPREYETLDLRELSLLAENHNRESQEKNIRAWRQAVAIVRMVAGLISSDSPPTNYEDIFGSLGEPLEDSLLEKKKSLLNAMEWGIEEFGISAPDIEDLQKEIEELER